MSAALEKITPREIKWMRLRDLTEERTGRNLLGLIDDRKLAVDTKQLLYVLSTDMNKAFDCLSHSLTTKISWRLVLWLWKWIS